MRSGTRRPTRSGQARGLRRPWITTAVSTLRAEPAAPTLNLVTDATKIGVTVVLPSPGSSPVTGGVLFYRTTGGSWQTTTLSTRGTTWTLSGLTKDHELRSQIRGQEQCRNRRVVSVGLHHD